MVQETRQSLSKDNLLKVLIIEDYLWSRDLIGRILEINGYKVFRVASGENGITWAINNQPDVILIDIYLPGLDGYKVANILKGNEETAHIPLIAFSSYIDDKREAILQAGFDEYIRKPFDLNKFPNQINRLIKGQV